MIEVNYNDYKRILEENMRLIPENHKLKEEIERINKERNKTYENGLNYFLELQEKKEEIERLNNIIKEAREILNTQLAFTSSYQLNYQSAMSIIEEAKSTLRGVDKN